MSTINEEVVKLSFDKRGFEKNSLDILKRLNEVKAALNFDQALKGLSQLNSASRDVTFDNMSSGIDSLNGKLSTMGVIGATVISSITMGAINAAKNLFNTAIIQPMRGGMREFETQMGAIQTILANTATKGTVLTDVTAALDELNAYADLTIYNFTDMTSSIGKFTTAGVALDVSVSAIKGIANLAALSGSNSQQASTAMYQLSQAISSGTVRLQDWNSVVNAGMGGEIFQQALIDTARIGNASIDSIIETAGGFRQSLEKEWLTSDVLLDTLSKFTGDVTDAQLEALGYTQEEIVAIQEMAVMANDAATKVKTITQLFDTMGEAVESGWSQTWRLILGDFEQAKSLFTGLADTLGGMISESADARNEIVASWADEGGRELFIRTITSGLDTVIQMSRDVKEAISDIFPRPSATRLYEITRGIKHFVESLKMGEETSEKFKNVVRGIAAVVDIVKMSFAAIITPILEMIKSLVPATNSIFDMASNAGLAIVSLRNFIKETNYFGGVITNVGVKIDTIVNVLGLLRDAFFKLDIVKDILGYFGLIDDPMARWDDARDSITGFEKTLLSLKDGLIGMRDSFLGLGIVQDVIGYFQNLNADDLQTAVDSINEATATMYARFAKAKEGLLEFKDTVLGMDSVQTFLGLLQGFNTVDDSGFRDEMWGALSPAQLLLDKVKGLVDSIIEFKDTILDINFDAIFGGDTETPLDSWMRGGDNSIGIFERLSNILGTIVGWLNTLVAKIGPTFFELSGKAADIASEMLGGITDAAVGFDWLGLIRAINAGLTTAILISIKSLFSGNIFEDLFEGFFGGDAKGLVESATELFDGLRGSLVAWQNSVKANTLLKIAAAIGIITISVVALSMVDKEKLYGALAAITAMMVQLFGGAGALSTISIRGAAKTSLTLIALSSAVLLLAFAIKTLGKLDAKELANGLVGVGGGLATLVVGVKALGATNTRGIFKASAAMIVMSVGLLVLSLAVKAFGKMDYDILTQGLLSIGASLLGFAAFSRAVNPARILTTAISVGVLAGSLIIMGFAIEKMGAISWDSMIRGLTGMGVALGLIVLAVTAVPATVALKAIGLVIVAGAVYILAQVLDKLGGMSWDSIARALVALGGALVILTAALYAMSGTLAGTAALVVASVGLMALAKAMQMLGGMSWDEIVRGLVAMAAMFVILGIAGLVLGPVVPVLLGVGAAMLIIGIGAAAMGGGIFLVATGLVLLAGSATAIAGAIVLVVGAVIGLIPAIVRALGLAIIELIVVIGDGGPMIFEAAKKLILGFLDAVIEVGPAIVDTIITLVMSLLSTIVENLPEFIEHGYFILRSLLQGIADNIADIVIVATDIVLGFVEGITEKLPDVIDAAFELVIAFIDGMTAAVTEHMPELLISMNELSIALIEGFVLGIIGGIPDTVQSIKDMGAAVLEGLADVFDIHSPSKKTKTQGKFAAIGFANGLVDENSALMAAVNTMADIILDVMSLREDDFMVLGTTFAVRFAKGYTETFTSQIEALAFLLTTLLIRLTMFKSRFYKLGGLLALAMVTGFIDGFTSRIVLITNLLTTLLLSMQAYSSRFYDTGVLLMTAFIEGILSQEVVLEDTFALLMDGVATTVAAKDGAFYAIGANLMLAMAQGIDDNAGAVARAAAAAADSAAAAAAAAAGIQSPSTVFLALGLYMSDGLALGIDRGNTAIQGASTRMASTVQNGMNLVIDKIGATLDTDMEFRPVISPVLDMADVDAGVYNMRRSFGEISVKATGTATSVREASENSITSDGTSASGSTFIQNNYSPKALSTEEIYRQTTNQISRAKAQVAAEV